METPLLAAEWEEFAQEVPDDLTFQALRALVDTAPASERARALARAAALSASWPDEICTISLYLGPVREGLEAHIASPAWPLVRTLNAYGVVGEEREWLAGLLAGGEELARLRGLGVPADDLTCPALARSRPLKNLRSLSLWVECDDLVSFRRLAGSPLLESLQRLEVLVTDRGGGAPQPAELVAALLGGGRLGRLTSLSISSSWSGAEGYLELLARRRPAGLRELALHAGPEVATLARFPDLCRGLAALDVSQSPLTDEGAAALSSCPALAGLERLNIGQTGLTAAGVAALRRGRFLSCLTHLALGENPLDDAGLEALAALPLERLLDLHLPVLQQAGPGGFTAFPSARGWEVLLRAPWMGGVEALLLRGNELGPEGHLALARATTLGNLHRLDLDRNAFEAESLTALLRSEHLGQLRELLLSTMDEPITDPAAMYALATSPCLQELERLEVGQMACDRTSAEALARSPSPGRLRWLTLAGCGLDDDGAEALAAAAWPRLRSLCLSNNPLKARGVEALARSPGLAGLWELRLAYTSPGDKGLRALARSPSLGRLVRLDLRGATARKAGAEALARSPVVGRLERVRVDRHDEPWLDSPTLRPVARAALKVGDADDEC